MKNFDAERLVREEIGDYLSRPVDSFEKEDLLEEIGVDSLDCTEIAINIEDKLDGLYVNIDKVAQARSFGDIVKIIEEAT